MLGMMLECGPFLLQKDGSLALNEYGWNKNANLLFIEQPVETGFAFSEVGSQ